MNTIFAITFLVYFVGVNCVPANIYFGNGMAIRSNQQQGMVFTGFFTPQNQNQEENGYNYEPPANQGEEDKNPTIVQMLPNIENATLFDEDDETLKILAEKDEEAMKETDAEEESDEEEDDEDDDDEDDDDDDYFSWPFLRSKMNGQQPSLNFFPISFGGYGRSSGNPVGTAAIANSFSTGKKGVASSSATAYGEAKSAKYEQRSNQESDITLSEEKNNAQNQNELNNGSSNVNNQDEILSTDKPTPVEEGSTEADELPQETSTENLETSTKIKEATVEDTEEQIPQEKNNGEDSIIIPKTDNQQPSYNFFPISFGGYGRSSGNPVGTAAVANSFNTGKKGVATSSATAYGEASSAKYEQRSNQESDITLSEEKNNAQNQNEFNNGSPNVNNQDEMLLTDKPTPVEEGSTEADKLPQETSTENLETSTKLKETTIEDTEEQIPQEKNNGEDSIVIPKRDNQQPSYNFFPISFGGYGRSSGNPVGTAAIANSFSTGKKGVASSTATAYGEASSAKYEQRSKQESDITLSEEKNNAQNQNEFNNGSPNVNNQDEILSTDKPTPVEEGSSKADELPQETSTENLETSTKIKETTVEDTEEQISQEKNNGEDSIIIPKRDNQQPSYNFFPISFGTYGRSVQSPIGTVAIANSFSTGQTGLATSNAKSLGTDQTLKQRFENARYQRPEGMICTQFYDQNNKGKIQMRFNYGVPQITEEQNVLPPNDKLETNVENDAQENEKINENNNIEKSTELNKTEITTEITVLSQESTTEINENATKIADKRSKQGEKIGDESDYVPSTKDLQDPSTNYFPISFNGDGRSGGNSVGNVAIANSFSTGEDGVAMSDAKASGEPNILTNESDIDKSQRKQVMVELKQNNETMEQTDSITTEGLQETTEGLQETTEYLESSTEHVGTTTENLEAITENLEITTENMETTTGYEEVTTATAEVTTENVETTSINVETTTKLETVSPQKTMKKSSKRKSNKANHFFRRINQQPSTNFFPISFGGYGRSGENQFGTVAVANSFNTGKGGIASSRATSYGEAFSPRNDANAARYA